MQWVYFFDGGLQVFPSWCLAAGCNLTLSVHFLSRYRWAAIVRWRKKVLSLQSCSGVGGTGDRRRGQVNNPQQLGGQKQGPSGAVCDFRVFIFREKGKEQVPRAAVPFSGILTTSLEKGCFSRPRFDFFVWCPSSYTSGGGSPFSRNDDGTSADFGLSPLVGSWDPLPNNLF